MPPNAVDCRASRRALQSRSPPTAFWSERTHHMTGSPAPDSSAAERPSDDRLESWKEIAAYMRRDVTTVQRWEKREGMPVHRHVHDRMGSVYAFKSDLDAWAQKRTLLVAEPEVEPVSDTASQPPARKSSRQRFGIRGVAAAAVLLTAVAIMTALIAWQLPRAETTPENPLADARFLPVTDFDGI